MQCSKTINIGEPENSLRLRIRFPRRNNQLRIKQRLGGETNMTEKKPSKMDKINALLNGAAGYLITSSGWDYMKDLIHVSNDQMLGTCAFGAAGLWIASKSTKKIQLILAERKEKQALARKEEVLLYIQEYLNSSQQTKEKSEKNNKE
jgi:hypothetical protein